MSRRRLGPWIAGALLAQACLAAPAVAEVSFGGRVDVPTGGTVKLWDTATSSLGPERGLVALTTSDAADLTETPTDLTLLGIGADGSVPTAQALPVAAGDLNDVALADLDGDARDQPLVVRGQANAASVLMIAEGALDLTGAPGGGEAPGPLEANTLTDIREVPFALDGKGRAEVPVKTFILAGDPPGQPTTPESHQPPPPVPPPGVRTGDPVCAPATARPAAAGSDRITLDAAQLLISQRIAQAAVRRANAVEAWLEAGIVAGDLCGNAFGPADFAGVGWAGGASNPPVAPTPRRIEVASAGERDDKDEHVTLSAAQLLINQRISQAAVRRVNALIARLQRGLTGADFRDGSLTVADLGPGARP